MLAPWKKSYDQIRQLIKKQRHYFANNGLFPVVMYGCESWTIKKAECRRIDGFEPRCWKRLLRVPWTAWRSNQSILKEISPEYSLGELMLEKIEGRRIRGRLNEMFGMHHRLDRYDVEQAPKIDGDGEGNLACFSSWGHQQLI